MTLNVTAAGLSDAKTRGQQRLQAGMHFRVETVTVESKSNRYPVYIGLGLLSKVGSLLRRPSGGTSLQEHKRPIRNCAVITDAQVARFFGDAVIASLRDADFQPHLITLPAGETTKTLRHAGFICEQLTRAGFSRADVILALGGGVIGDLAGFAAAIFLRGISYINIPTTVTAQCDSSIGGKTGVNTRYGKNLLGAFHPPAFVVTDVDTLQTLPERIFNEGCAEVIKHAVTLDRGFFADLLGAGTDWRPGGVATNQARMRRARMEIIRRNVQLKADIVGDDEFESFTAGGRRALLNFGHTVGHGVESAAGYNGLLHGEAVSIGMIAAARLSVLKAGLPEGSVEQLEKLLRTWDLPTQLPKGVSKQKILARMRTDKKFVGGTIRFVLLSKLGTARLSEPGEVEWSDLARVVEQLTPP